MDIHSTSYWRLLEDPRSYLDAIDLIHQRQPLLPVCGGSQPPIGAPGATPISVAARGEFAAP